MGALGLSRKPTARPHNVEIWRARALDLGRKYKCIFVQGWTPSIMPNFCKEKPLNGNHLLRANLYQIFQMLTVFLGSKLTF